MSSCAKQKVIFLPDQSCFLGMFRGINILIGEHVETLTRKELEKVIWANARLNNRTGKLLSGIITMLYCLYLISYPNYTNFLH